MPERLSHRDSTNPNVEFNLAVMLAPANSYIREYVIKWQSKFDFPNRHINNET